MKIAYSILNPKQINHFCHLLPEYLFREGVQVECLERRPTSLECFQRRIDIVDFHWIENQWRYCGPLFFVIGVAFYRLKLKRSGVKLFWTVHNLYPHEKNVYSWFFWLSFFFMVRLVDGIVVFSHWQKKEMQKRFFLNESSKITVIPHPSYIGAYPFSVTREEARRILKIGQDKFVFLFFGLIRDYKGILEFVDLFRRERETNDLLLIAGKPYKNLGIHLAGKSDASIRMDLRYIPDPEVQYYFQAADVCIFPFKRVTNSGSFMLALSMKKPVIVPKSGSLQEIAEPDFGIQYDNNEALLHALKDIKKMDLTQMGEKAYQKALKYGWLDFAQQYKKAYEEAVK